MGNVHPVLLKDALNIPLSHIHARELVYQRDDSHDLMIGDTDYLAVEVCFKHGTNAGYRPLEGMTSPSTCNKI